MSTRDSRQLVEELAQRALSANVYLSTAESCTGGGIAYMLTEISGSSQWFDRAFVTYSNEAKQQMLGVASDILQSQGAVSEATVQAMAVAALERSMAQVSVAVSGIAGPTGGSVEKPVGLVWFCWAWRADNGVNNTEGVIHRRSEQQLFSGDRHAVRQQTIDFAIQGLMLSIDERGRSV